ncbi:MAG: GDSL-type esterase/lipase family protein [Chloroflexota bacterium]
MKQLLHSRKSYVLAACVLLIISMIGVAALTFRAYANADEHNQLNFFLYLPLIRVSDEVDPPVLATPAASATHTAEPGSTPLPTLSGTATVNPSTTPGSTETAAPSATPTNSNPSEPTATSSATATPTPTEESNIPDITREPIPPQSAAAGNNPQIEVANRSGVSGYTVGIFGSGFGYPQGNGSVTILNAVAEVLEWTDTYIEVVVPDQEVGSGSLTVTTNENQAASSPFEQYTINPAFTGSPQTRFVDVALGKEPVLQNLESFFCFRQPENQVEEPIYFLTDYRCGYDRYVVVGSATFLADEQAGETAIISVDLEQTVEGRYYFQFESGAGWYSDVPGDGNGTSYPYNYTIDISNNTSDGLDGDWLTVETVRGNIKGTRLHALDIPDGGYYAIRLRVTQGSNDYSEASGNDFVIRQIHLYQQIGDGSQPDTYAVFGDSLTADAFQITGLHGLSSRLNHQRDDGYDPIVSIFGLSGKNSFGLTREFDDSDIYDALETYGYGENTRYWGIGLGTNDMGWEVALDLYDENLEGIIIELINAGKVPVIARMPDTDESRGGFGTIETKLRILADIDALVAEYQLPPGPDFYTEYRRNIEFNNSSYFREFDGTHHLNPGYAALVDGWRKSFQAATSN